MDFESGFSMGQQILSEARQRRRDASANERDEASAKLIKQQARDLKQQTKAKKGVGGYKAEAKSEKKLAKLAPKEKRIELKSKRAAAVQAKIKADLDKRVYEQYGPEDITSLKNASVQSTTAAAHQAQATADLKREEADTFRQRTEADQAVASTNAAASATTANANFLQAKTKADELKAARESSETTTGHLVSLDEEYNNVATMMANPPRLENGKIDYGPAYDAWSNDISTAITRLASSTSPSEEVNTRATTAAGFLQEAFDTARGGHQKEQGWLNNQALKVSKGKQAANVQKYDQGERLERMRNLHGKQGEDDVNTRLEVLEMFRSKGVPLSYLRRDSKEFNSIFAFEQSEAMPFQILKDKDGGEYSSIDHPIMLIDRTATLSSAEAFANKWVAENAPPKAETENRDGVPLKSAMPSFDMGAPTTGNTTTTRRVGGNLQTTGTPIGSELYPHSKAVDVQSFLSGWEGGQPLVGGSFLDGPTISPRSEQPTREQMGPTGIGGEGEGEGSTRYLDPQGTKSMPELPPAQRELMQDSGINEKQAGILDDLGIDWKNSSIGGVQLIKRELDRLESDIKSGTDELNRLERQLKTGLKDDRNFKPSRLGLGSSNPVLSPSQKASLREKISLSESELEQMKAQKVKLNDSIRTKNPSVSPKDVRIPEGSRELLRELERIKRLAKSKRREANESPNIEPVGVTGSRPNAAMYKEAEALEARALEIEKRLEELK